MKTRFECLHLFHRYLMNYLVLSQTLFQILEINLMDKIDIASEINNNAV